MAQAIITPEAVVLDFERAGVPSRTLAMALDLLALVVTWAVLGVAAALAVGFEGVGAAVWYALTSLALVFVWFCGFETLWRGRTPGKAALGLRVVGVDGTPIRFQQAFLRITVGLVDFLLLPIGVIAVLTILLSPRDQRLGDMAAGTLVVRERSAQSFVAPAWFAPPPGYEGYAASLDVAALDRDTYGLVRSYLLRMAELGPAGRDHLAVLLANPIAQRMHHTPPPTVTPHAFLACVAAAWQRAHGAPPPPAYAPVPMPPPRPVAAPPPVGPFPAPPPPPGPPPAPPPPGPSGPYGPPPPGPPYRA
ncbi:MAG TPA: RDD family protein [Acidimicrobiales bacterium]